MIPAWGDTVSHQVVVRVQNVIEVPGGELLHDLMQVEICRTFSTVQSGKMRRDVKQGSEDGFRQTQVSGMQFLVDEDQPTIVIPGANLRVVPVLAADLVCVSIGVVEVGALIVQQTQQLFLSGCVQPKKAVQVGVVGVPGEESLREGVQIFPQGQETRVFGGLQRGKGVHQL